ncbi:hypothetical protein MUN81_22535 (plasmid) [Hymenobacter sp. 5317J-9]|uniref:hypothetical protein n=1 Tax=Hymenobacter sp. 5317J-9 TaxID=2932250 RepID=UPI001FD6A4F2|nr:hypothetical protein [Hymenobacter sp. 5317J-9]UOR00221.1 hypothetical protein MUN81_22535 [Hymenobacter sp. 5317J-9]
MAEPIVVIHGVANRDRAAFEESVAYLQHELGPAWQLLPVFWGDLGGQGTDINDCLPVLREGEWGVRAAGVRGAGALPAPFPSLPADALGAGQTSNETRAELIAAAATNGGAMVRGVVTDDHVKRAAEQELPTTKVLQYLDDEAVFQDLGKAIRAALESADAAVNPSAAPGDELVRGAGGTAASEISDDQVRGLLDPLTKAARNVIHAVDDILGRTLGNRLGQLNQRLRGGVMPPLSAFFGDIIVYQRNRARIQQRIWDALAPYGAGCGTAAKPVHVVAHSLGGVIAFDAAVQREQPLWMKSFTTFGSQSAFFHIVDPRETLTTYRKDFPVTLPPTIAKWTNLWDTVDLLAFTAGTVFRLHDGSRPKDTPLRDLLSQIIDEKAWMHSVYWREAVDANPTALVKAIKESVAEDTHWNSPEAKSN